MTYEEFKESEKRFVQYFGAKNIPAEYSSMLYEMVENLPLKDFESIITQTIMNETRLPNLAQVAKYAKPFLDSFARSNKAIGSCSKCNGGRFLYAMLREMPHIEFVFVCSFCEQEPDNRIAMWSDSYKDTHIPFNPWRRDSYEKAMDMQKESRRKSIGENNFFPMSLKDKPRKYSDKSENFNPAYKALKSKNIRSLSPRKGRT